MKTLTIPRSEPKPKPDRISALPDPILIRILSLLPTNQFIATATLCKRWRYLWFSATSLIFHFNGDLDSCCYFMDFIAATLMFNNAPKIDKFSVTMNSNWTCRNNCVTTVSTWIRFAMVKLVEELHVHLDGCKYTLPEQVYQNDRIRVLSFKNCDIELPESGVSWPSLEFLRIDDCGSITKEMIRKILNGCPKIVCFDVVDSFDPDRGCEVNHHYEYIRLASS